MGSRLTDLPGGVLVPSRLTLDTLTANDGSSTGSSYSESTPRPGTPVPTDGRNRLRAEVSHAQGADLDLRVIRAGMPGLDGCSLAYKTGSDSEWRGWNPPLWLERWVSLDWTSTDDFLRADAVTIPSTQEVVVVRRSTTTGLAASRIVNPDTLVAGAVGSGTMAAGATWNHPACCILPDERILCLYGGRVYYSDDGTTWATYSAHPFTDSTTNFGRARLAFYRGDLLLLVEDTATADTVHQFASSDLGATFTLVETVAAVGTQFSVLPTPAGLFVVFKGPATSYPYIRQIGAASDPISRAEGDELQFATRFVTGIDQVIAAADPDGVMWCYVGGTGDNYYLFVSTDDGRTWTECHGIPFDGGSSSDRQLFEALTPSAGRMILVHGWETDTGTYDGSLAANAFGGWTSVTVGPPEGETGWAYTHRLGSAGYSVTYGSADIVGTVWTPMELPSAGGGWSLTGTAGTLGSGLMTITTAAAAGWYSRALDAGGAHVICAELAVTSGGSISSADVALAGRVADGTDDWHWQIYLATTGLRVVDLNDGGATIATVALDMTSARQVLVACTEGGVLSVWYRTPGETKWTNAVDAYALTDDTATPAAVGVLDLGHMTAATATSTWTSVAHQRWSTGTTAQARLYTGSSDIFGRSLSTWPIPIPDLSDEDGHACYLSAAAGPAKYADGLTVEAEHDYSLDHAFPEVAPSPRVRWRSTDTSEQRITFDLEASTWLGQAVGLYIGRANFRTAYLEYHDGAAWQTAGTWDAATGFATSLTYDRTGDTIVPRSGTADAARYLWAGELIGGHAILGGTYYRTVLGQSGGSWCDDTTTRPEVRLGGLTGAEGANGSVVLVAPSGLLVVYLTSSQRRRYWRVRIPSQSTPDGYFEAGILLAGRVQPWGARVDWTRSDEWAATAEPSRDAAGTLRVRERGDVSRAWTMSWQDAVHHRTLRSGLDHDYIGVSGGLALHAGEDVPMALAALLRETRSGKIPVVVVEELPSSSGMTTDPSRILYSRILGPIRANGVSGTLGLDEILRVEGITAEEVV